MQNREIELKFGFDGNNYNLRENFKKIGKVSPELTLRLDNTYFDTDTKDLYAIKCGLRIRRSDDFSEQTIKVKGESLGGLHKRKEYNLPIDRDVKLPELEKFPKDILPADYNLEDIKSRLKSVCHINFTRKLFNLEMLDSTFEVACDTGYIEIDGHKRYPLNELEIELKDSKVTDDELLSLFSIVCTQLATQNIPLLLEPFSKMHRATLLQMNTVPSVDLNGVYEQLSLVDYTRSLIVRFEHLYGHFILSHDGALFIQICSVIECLLFCLKQLKKRNLPAFINVKKEPVDYEDDLKIIIRLLKDFFKTCVHQRKSVMVNCLKQNTDKLQAAVEKIRNSEKENKIFLIPLKLRYLLSLIV